MFNIETIIENPIKALLESAPIGSIWQLSLKDKSKVIYQKVEQGKRKDIQFKWVGEDGKTSGRSSGLYYDYITYIKKIK